MRRPAQAEFHCSICDWPVDLKTCKTDDAGKPVHEECYMLRELTKSARQPTLRDEGIGAGGAKGARRRNSQQMQDRNLPGPPLS